MLYLPLDKLAMNQATSSGLPKRVVENPEDVGVLNTLFDGRNTTRPVEPLEANAR